MIAKQKERKPLLGLCPIGKFVFSNEDALRYKGLLQNKLQQWRIPYVDLEHVLDDGLVKDHRQVDTVVDHFKKAGVECLFVPHCNFGTESAVGMIAKKLNLPTLLWGPRDEAPLPDGRRLCDTLCGLLASSKVLHRVGVPFSYIENCWIDDDPLQEGVDRFLRVVNVANAFRKGFKVGLVGSRIDFFWNTIIDEGELLNRFNVEVQTFDMVEFIRAAKERAVRERVGYEEELRELQRRLTITGFHDSAPLINVLAVRDELQSLAAQFNLEGFAFRTFMSIIEEIGSYCSFAESAVTENYAFGHECDIHGTISEVLLRRANFNAVPSYLAEFTVRHPTNENAVLLWHISAPLSMCHPEVTPEIGPHWILPSPYSGMLHFRLKDGPVTVARFDGGQGEYKLGVGVGKSVDGPKTLNNYLWLGVNDWPKWERTLISGPFVHHIAMAYGNYVPILLEACQYIPGVEPVEFGS